MKFYSCEIEGDAGVELTQAEYDALEAAGKIEPDTNYYIKDGKGVEPGIAKDIEYIKDTLDATFALISEGGASIGGGSVEYLAEEYNPDHTYMTEENCYCMHDGELFKCLEDDTTGEWDSSKWERTYLSEVSNTNSNSIQKSILRTAYNSGTRADGNIVVDVSKAKTATLLLKRWTGSSGNVIARYSLDDNDLITFTGSSTTIDVNGYNELSVTLVVTTASTGWECEVQLN